MWRDNVQSLLAMLSIVLCGNVVHAETTPLSPLTFLPGPGLSSATEPSAQERSVTCLTQAIVYEAGTEPVEGQQAVAQVILNRLHSPAYPKNLCDVVYQGSNRRTGCQFTFTCDGSLRRKMPDRLFLAARYVAQTALDGTLPDRVGGATHYHAYYVSPYWAPTLNRVARIGAHIFYQQKWAGSAQPAIRADFIPARAVTPTPATVMQPTEPHSFSPWGTSLMQNRPDIAALSNSR